MQKEAKRYEIHRQSHIQFRRKYCKDSSENTKKNEWKELGDTRGENEFRHPRANECWK